jgi:hypothetical protein
MKSKAADNLQGGKRSVNLKTHKSLFLARSLLLPRRRRTRAVRRCFMSTSKTFLVALFAAGLSLGAAAQLPPPPPIPPPPPVEIRSTIVEVAPPPVRVETRTARPGVGYLWADGYWDWADRWVWVPGRWVTPVARATWVPAEYRRVRTGYRYVPAHWSNQTVVAVERVGSAGRGRAVGHVKAKGKGHSKAKGKGHAKYD